MAKEVHYNSKDHISADSAPDPYNRPAFSLGNRLRRLFWNICWLLFYRTSPRPFHPWRSMILRSFGAKVGANCHFYPSSRVHSPWNLVCDSEVTAGDDVELYNPAPLHLGSHVIISQGAYICGATHSFDEADFPLLTYAMEIGPYAWVCARACVGPGVKIGEGAVLGLASVATKNLEAWTVYAGAPAVRVKERQKHAIHFERMNGNP